MPAEDKMIRDDLTQNIIGCSYKVHNALGPGFLEKVYENALRIEIEKAGISVKQQEPIKVFYAGQVVGEYWADLWVADCLIIEVKAVQAVAKEHEVQLVNYLTATGVNDGVLINVGPSVQVKRKFRQFKPKGSLLNALTDLS
jgi:GxxExxY protein